MSFNFIDTSLIEVNKDSEVSITHIGDQNNHPIITIDNFLKNPEDLLSMLKSYPIEKDTNLWWGHPISQELKFPQIRETILILAKQVYGITHVTNPNSEIDFQFNVVPTNKKAWKTNTLPHIDDAFVAASIFLNSNEVIRGGTAFYKNKKINIDHEVSYIDESFKETGAYWAIQKLYDREKRNNHEVIYDSRDIDEDEWEFLYLAEAKFNRFVMHPSYVFHTPYVHKDWFVEEERVNFVGFIK